MQNLKYKLLENKIKNNIKFKDKMKIKTSYPVIIDGKDISPRDYYSSASGDISVDMDFLPEEEVTADGVKVVTKYPVILDGTDVSPRDYYSNASGIYSQLDLASIAQAAEQYKKSGTAPSSSAQKAAKEKGLFWDKAKGAWQSFSTSQTGQVALQQLDAYLTARRDARFGTSSGGGFMPSEQATTAPTQPMSRGAKIALIAGGIVVAGLIVYSIVAGGKTQK
jgi:hypothetical protein